MLYGLFSAARVDILPPVMSEAAMFETGTRTRRMMELALEEACRRLPNGGDHEIRSFVADRLMRHIANNPATLGEFGIVARKALADFQSMELNVYRLCREKFA